ncbi:MAG: Tex-like N-terminal domain-containing protein [Pirellulaceae bacterium]|jgi:uncharacterized protein|nr:Tex-like N-terminal domain-containing protein [Pirellulaceae bacterium]
MLSPTHIDIAQLAAMLALPVDRVDSTLRLLDEGNTSSFIARYRKDATGGIGETKVREIRRLANKLRSLEDRKGTICKSIETRGLLTVELSAAIQSAASAKDLEDLYLPFKARKQTMATIARQRGLETLAREILGGTLSEADLSARLVAHASDAAGPSSPDDALAGAGHIVAEWYSDRADVRSCLRKLIRENGRIVCNRVESDGSTKGAANQKQRQKLEKAYRDYFTFSESVRAIPPHRILAINRGERSKVLRVRMDIDLAAMQEAVEQRLLPAEHPQAEFLHRCVSDALQRLILPSLERECRRELTEKAEERAIEVFACNLRNLLLQPPVRGHRIVAIAAGYRSGCKLAAVDEFGNVLDHDLIHVIGDAQRRVAGRQILVNMIREHQISVIAIGNGNACRQAEQLVADVIATELADLDLVYTIVNEAGASVYSTSMVGVEELPQFDVELRSAISIGRRLLDPLSELVKISPANIGVGLYQHDLKARNLQESLDAVVAACVNYVSVDVNTASPALLRYVSGLNQLSARSLYEYRCKNGPFCNREQFQDVPTFGDVAYVQAAGFLKINDGDNPLDATLIHPESYEIAGRILERLGVQADQPAPATADSSKADAPSSSALDLSEPLTGLDISALAVEFGIGEMLLTDILSALTKPRRDPREDLPSPVFRRSIMKLVDLKPGMELQGTVLNVVDFGAFVDIGISDNALVHISRLVDRFVEDPHEVVGVGDVLRVWVLGIEKDRRRVSLTAIDPNAQPPAAQQATSETTPAAKKKGAPPPRPHIKQMVKSGGAKRTSRGKTSKPPSRPVTPLTEGMVAGTEPLRSFADLQQFLSASQPKNDVSDESAGD